MPSLLQTMAGVLFPMTTAVEAAVRDVLSGAVEYVQLSIDTAKEIIGLEEKGRCALNELPRKVPADKPRYIGKHQRSHDNEEKDDLLISLIPTYYTQVPPLRLSTHSRGRLPQEHRYVC